MFAFCSTWQFKSRFLYCFSIYINSNATIVSVHSNVTNTVNTRFKLNLRSNKSSTPALRDVTSPLFWPGALFEHTESFSGQETSSLFQTHRQNGTRLYLREVIPLIYKTPKQGFLPPHFPGAIPFKRTCPLYWAHMHTQDQKKNKQRQFKYQPNLPSVWMEGLLRGSASARPVCCGANVFRLWIHGWKANWETTKQGYSIKLL